MQSRAIGSQRGGRGEEGQGRQWPRDPKTPSWGPGSCLGTVAWGGSDRDSHTYPTSVLGRAGGVGDQSQQGAEVTRDRGLRLRSGVSLGSQVTGQGGALQPRVRPSQSQSYRKGCRPSHCSQSQPIWACPSPKFHSRVTDTNSSTWLLQQSPPRGFPQKAAPGRRIRPAKVPGQVAELSRGSWVEARGALGTKEGTSSLKGLSLTAGESIALETGGLREAGPRQPPAPYYKEMSSGVLAPPGAHNMMCSCLPVLVGLPLRQGNKQ